MGSGPGVKLIGATRSVFSRGSAGNFRYAGQAAAGRFGAVPDDLGPTADEWASSMNENSPEKMRTEQGSVTESKRMQRPSKIKKTSAQRTNLQHCERSPRGGQECSSRLHATHLAHLLFCLSHSAVVSSRLHLNIEIAGCSRRPCRTSPGHQWSPSEVERVDRARGEEQGPGEADDLPRDHGEEQQEQNGATDDEGAELVDDLVGVAVGVRLVGVAVGVRCHS
eukprot:scaffold87649_cov52-Phaeocystis_antarctica.AAC.2